MMILREAVMARLRVGSNEVAKTGEHASVVINRVTSLRLVRTRPDR